MTPASTTERVYNKVGSTIWNGETGKALRRRGSEALMVSLYLMTSPHSNMLGLYYQAIPYIAYETGLGEEGARKGLQSCIDVGFCAYDPDSEMVWIYEMAKWQVAEQLKASDHRCKGIQRYYDALPECPFLEPFFDRYAEAFHLTRRREKSNPMQQSLMLVGQAPYQAPRKPTTTTTATTTATKETDKLSLVSSRPKTAERPAVLDLGIPPGKPPDGPPACPHLAILALWREVLPECPQHLPSQWKGTRADHLRARWRETAVEKSWTDEGQGLVYLRKLFVWCRQSQFLSGKIPPRQGHKQFEFELAWLVNPTNWAKVLEGKYHEGS